MSDSERMERRSGKQGQRKWAEGMAVAACVDVGMDEDEDEVVCDEESVAAAMMSLFALRNEIA